MDGRKLVWKEKLSGLARLGHSAPGCRGIARAGRRRAALAARRVFGRIAANKYRAASQAGFAKSGSGNSN